MSCCKVTFEGSFVVLEKHLKEKISTSLDVHKLGETTALVQTNLSDLFDDISYLKGSEFDGTKIVDVVLASDKDKSTASSMGFELINKEEKVDNLNDVTTSQILCDNDNNNTGFCKEKALENLSRGIMDAQLNPKQPLHKDDPFSIVTQKNNLLVTSLVVAGLMFVSSLF